MTHTITDQREAREIEAADAAEVVVRIDAFDAFDLDVADGVVIVTADGCSFIGAIVDIDEDDVLVELA